MFVVGNWVFKLTLGQRTRTVDNIFKRQSLPFQNVSTEEHRLDVVNILQAQAMKMYPHCYPFPQQVVAFPSAFSPSPNYLPYIFRLHSHAFVSSTWQSSHWLGEKILWQESQN